MYTSCGVGPKWPIPTTYAISRGAHHFARAPPGVVCTIADGVEVHPQWSTPQRRGLRHQPQCTPKVVYTTRLCSFGICSAWRTPLWRTPIWPTPPWATRRPDAYPRPQGLAHTHEVYSAIKGCPSALAGCPLSRFTPHSRGLLVPLLLDRPFLRCLSLIYEVHNSQVIGRSLRL